MTVYFLTASLTHLSLSGGQCIRISKNYSSVEYRSETPGVGGAMLIMEINPHPSVPGWEGGVMSFVDISLNSAGGSLIQASLPKPGQGRGVSDLIHYSICIN